MKAMRNIRKPQIKLGRVRSDSPKYGRGGTESRQMLGAFTPRNQRVLVKVKQSYNKSAGNWRNHGRYLERDNARHGD
jgi:hypothetical protein